MRVVVALGGNALLRRGEPLTASNQRDNARRACRALAPVALEHELVVSHGNGPQVGLLALQGAAYKPDEAYPLDVLDSETEGMIGYVLEQELGNELPFDRRLATLLTQVEVDAGDPAFADPTKPVGPVYDVQEAEALAAHDGWVFKRDGDGMRRVVPSPMPQRIFELEPIGWLLERGCVVICAGGGGIPVMYTDDAGPAVAFHLTDHLGSCVAVLDGTGAVEIGEAVMGAGAAFIMPSTLSILVNVFPPHERTKAIAIWMRVSPASSALAHELEPSRRPTRTSTPESARLRAWA
jgi:hypothetical protein